MTRARSVRTRIARAIVAAFTVAAAIGVAGVAPAAAASFTAGNVVVYRVGDGAAGLVNTGAAVFLDEYTPTGTLVQSIPMPTTASGANKPLIASGTATSEGLLTNSPDGAWLALTGYGTTLGGGSSLAGTASATVNRTVGIVDSCGVIDTSTGISNLYDANNPRSAVTTDGTKIWVGGAGSATTGGVGYITKGGTTATQLSTTVTNIRQVNIFDSQLYNSDSSGSAVRIGSVGSGTPTTAPQTITNLPGTPASGTSPYSFALVDIDSGVAGVDTLYIAEDTASGGQIQKYSLVSGTWTAKGTIAAASIRGLAASVSGTSVTVFGTTGGSTASGGGSLYKLTDASGPNATITGSLSTIATAAANEAFRGVAFAPGGCSTPVTPEVPYPVLFGVVGIGLGGATVLVMRRRAAHRMA